MGIYSDGKVYGISFMLNEEEEAVYEVKSDLPLTPKQIKDIQEYYETVKQEQKKTFMFGIMHSVRPRTVQILFSRGFHVRQI